MSKLLNNPNKSIAACIEDTGKAIDTFFEPITPRTSKQLPLRADYLTYEDDAFDLGFYRLVDTLTNLHNGGTKTGKKLVSVAKV